MFFSKILFHCLIFLLDFLLPLSSSSSLFLRLLLHLLFLIISSSTCFLSLRYSLDSSYYLPRFYSKYVFSSAIIPFFYLSVVLSPGFIPPSSLFPPPPFHVKALFPFPFTFLKGGIPFLLSAYSLVLFVSSLTQLSSPTFPLLSRCYFIGIFPSTLFIPSLLPRLLSSTGLSHVLISHFSFSFFFCFFL